MKVTDPSIPVRPSPRVQGLRPSATLAMNEASRRLQAQGRPVYRLGFGQSPFPVPRPVVAALEAHAGEKDYLPVKGLPSLREAVAGWHRRVDGIAATGEDILIGPGSKELIFLVQLAYDADIVIPAPAWVSYAPQAHLLGRAVRWIQTRKEDGWRLSPDDLARACRDHPDRARLLILNYPGNPTGVTYGDDQLALLAQTAARHQVLILADEIYGGVHHTGAHRSIATRYPEGTVISGGLSKWCGAGGWRLGTLCFPPSLRWLLDAVACVASETYSAASAPVQHAAVVAFNGGDAIDRYLHDSRRVVRAMGRWVCRRLQAAGVDVVPPEGGFYLFPDFAPHQERLHARGIQTSRDLCQRLLVDTGVAMLPGSDFGRPAGELTCRLAYVDFDGAAALDAAAAIPAAEELGDAFLAAHGGTVVTGVDRLMQWLDRDA